MYKGVPLLTGYFQPYTYHGDCLRTYHEVFGTHSPYANVIDAVTNPPPLFSNEFGVGIKVRDKPIEKIVPMDLKEVYHGSVKRMKILRHEFVEGDQSRTQIRFVYSTINTIKYNLVKYNFIFKGNEFWSCR